MSGSFGSSGTKSSRCFSQVGGIQAVAMAMEDGAVLAKIFSHLLREDQISSFLYAFQELRQERVARMLRSETFNNSFMSLETCETTEMRDNGMKMLQAAGKNVMDSGEENLTEAWEEIKYTFAYDCEDEADDWSVFELSQPSVSSLINDAGG
jgi:salicylate hydroxylase